MTEQEVAKYVAMLRIGAELKDLLGCPFCGAFPKVTKYPMEGAHPDHDLCRCETIGCPLSKFAITRDKWNTRATG